MFTMAALSLLSKPNLFLRPRSAETDDLSKSLAMEEMDASNGVNFPYYDPDTKMVYLVGKGDSVIRYYELVPEPPYCHFLTMFQSSDPQKGCGFMPKRGCDVNHNEVMKFYKLHSTKPICEPISFTVPRKSELFQTDLFPETAGDEAALTADEWIGGKDSDPVMISLEGGFKAKEKGATAIGTKNVMAALSSKKIDRGGSSSDGLADQVAALTKTVEENRQEIAQLKEEVKQLKEK